jgi:hypothetical protein
MTRANRHRDQRRTDHRRCRGEAAQRLASEVRGEQCTYRDAARDADAAQHLRSGKHSHHTSL